ncbi:MAG TPA: peptidylprolyl isomerase [Allosphingosinicella sp.]|jgi:peptidyl-prolyl cis-trans isomerase SurA
MMKLGTFHRAAFVLAGTLAATAAVAQTAGSADNQAGLNIPQDARFLAPENPSVRKATAIVNGTVITGTDVDHRLALIRLANGGDIPAEELPRLRQQVLRNLVDETLQIQAAEAEDIKIDAKELDQYFGRYAQNFKQTPAQFAAYLRSVGSSDTSIKRQIHGELAWTRLQRRQIEPFVNVSEEEVQAVIARLNAARGTQEYKVSEIFISATPETAAEARANAQRIVEQLRGGASFVAYARQFSEASTAAVGGDLDFVRAEQLPEPLAAAVQQMPVGAVSDPIVVPGGFSIIAVTDTRQVLTADPRDAVLSLKQLSLSFAANTPRPAAENRIQQLVKAAQSMGGCGRAEEAASAIGAEVVSNDQVKVRDLPPPLQQTLLALGVGQTTPPFGSVADRISILVLCGRDDPAPVTDVSFEQVHSQLAENRVNLRARRYLRDLRRDAVVDYR